MLAAAAAVVSVGVQEGEGGRCARSRRRCCGPSATGAGPVREMLAERLGDRSLNIAYWLPDREIFVDERGHPVDLPDSGSGRTWTAVEREGNRVAAIVHDAELDATPELVHAAASAAALAIDNERLKADLRARLEELRHSRRRIVEAADDARRQIERDLHDGAQQQLVSLALDLRLLRARLKHEPEVAETVEELADKLATALAELRELARGIHPAVLSDHGLGPAIHVLVERSPLTVECDLAFEDRLPAPVEAAAYFVVAEGLTNVIKYANATKATVSVRRRGGMVEVAVGDDGIGGARIDAGSGLRGLSDRLAALEGELELDSPLGEGTRLSAQIPLTGTTLMRRLLFLALVLACSPAAAAPRPCARPTSRSRASRRRASGRRPAATPERGGGLRVASARIAAISHGQASDPFWAIVKKGLDDAARQTGVAVSYRAPDSYDIARMRRLIDEAIEANLDGLIVSLPDVQGLRAPIRRARRAGIPVDLDQLGQRSLPRPRDPRPRRPARVPRRLRGRPPDGEGRGPPRAVRQPGGRATPASTSAAAASARPAPPGGTSAVLGIDIQDPDQAQQRIAQAVRDSEADGILTLGTAGAMPALAALRAGFGRRVQLATFDLSPDVLRGRADQADAVRRRPAAVPAGLPARRAAGRALAPHAVPARAAS